MGNRTQADRAMWKAALLLAACSIPACGDSESSSSGPYHNAGGSAQDAGGSAGDSSVGGTGGAAASSGSGGLAGSSGHGGSGGAAGASGSGGLAGSAGQGGSGGSAGTAGDAGAGGTAGIGGAGGMHVPGFEPGHVFVAGSRNAEVFEFDSALNPVTSWTDPTFGQQLPAPGQPFENGPAGMVFDADGNLVVAALDQFCIFSKPDVLLACHPKTKSQPTENIIFDHIGNLYTTTSTGGTNEIHQYDSSYQYIKTFSIPTGQLTGITCDPNADLFVASQVSSGGRIYKMDKTTLQILDTIDLDGLPEGIQFAAGGAILVGAASYGIRRIVAASPLILMTTYQDPGLLWPVPVTIDNAGNVYTADYENGDGTAPADLYVFDPNGNVIHSVIASEVYGPFGMVVAGTYLPCGAYHLASL